MSGGNLTPPLVHLTTPYVADAHAPFSYLFATVSDRLSRNIAEGRAAKCCKRVSPTLLQDVVTHLRLCCEETTRSGLLFP